MEHSFRLMMVVVAVGLAPGCSKGSPSVESVPTANDASAAATPSGPGPVVITTTAEAASAVGREVRVEGIARDAKLSAVVMAGDLVVYCLDLNAWPDERSNQTVAVHGLLEQTDEFSAAEADPVSAGTSGSVYVIRRCVVE